VAFRTLQRPHFSTLQRNIFPIYFSLQTALPVAVAITFPSSSLLGLLAEDAIYVALVPLSVIFLSGLANLVYLGPKTREVMDRRHHQGMYFGKRWSPALIKAMRNRFRYWSMLTTAQKLSMGRRATIQELTRSKWMLSINSLGKSMAILVLSTWLLLSQPCHMALSLEIDSLNRQRNRCLWWAGIDAYTLVSKNLPCTTMWPKPDVPKIMSDFNSLRFNFGKDCSFHVSEYQIGPLPCSCTFGHVVQFTCVLENNNLAQLII
jgi:hypothetical protein